MGDPNRPSGDQPEKEDTHLVIPYFPGDRGNLGADPAADRPIKPPHISWACPGISVNGVSHAGSYVPGMPMTVNVDVVNYGKGTSTPLVNVVVWWSVPGTAFTMPLTYFGQTTVPVPSHGTKRTSPDIVGTIPAGSPSHVCLLVSVSAPGVDPLLPGPVDALNDRHWAELNLNAVSITAAGAFSFLFWAVNPLFERAAFDLVVQPVDRDSLATLARYMRAEPVPAEQAAISVRPLMPSPDDVDTNRTDRLVVELDGQSRIPVVVDGRLPDRLAEIQISAVEVLVTGRDDENRGRALGALGVVMHRDLDDR